LPSRVTFAATEAAQEIGFLPSSMVEQVIPTRDEAVKKRDKLTAKMTPDQIAEAQRRAREWVAKK
jgi:hypothetical protein